MTELQTAIHDEARQGEQFAPFYNDTNTYNKYFYIESYGCAMNFNDSEIVASILYEQGYGATKDVNIANLILINTCSIREKAEQSVRNKLRQFNRLKKEKPGLKIGILGCMAERLKAQLMEQEKLVDMVVGPDAYRSLPALIQEVNDGNKGLNVLLSREETYADISPVRLDENGISSFVSIMRGCNNMCSFCVVPFTRGRERSREPKSIVQEATDLFNNNYKEVTLLGQNVDSYLYTEDNGITTTFADLLVMVAKISPKLRVRFSTSHPKDITDDVLFAMQAHNNICKYIHLPVQSGNTRILQLMNRTYTREWYIKKVDRIKELLPGCGLSTDIITGFCTETDEEHKDTLSIIEYAKYNLAYMYAYSERPGTLAARRFEDDIPNDVKLKRLDEIIALQREIGKQNNLLEIGTEHIVLVENFSKKSEDHLFGRTDTNKGVVLAKGAAKKGDYVKVKITNVTSGTLIGELLQILD
jgi:tRNA-2-methylthio-N6-dimethylallyladenosine synthase